MYRDITKVSYTKEDIKKEIQLIVILLIRFESLIFIVCFYL